MISCLNTVPEGMVFQPSDYLLLTHYLLKKNQGKDSQITIIPVIDLSKHEPRDLLALVFAMVGPEDRVWLSMAGQLHFFRLRNSGQTTQEGCWKQQGKPHGIKAPGSKAEIGEKRILVFHLHGKPKQIRTDWVIHEYSLPQGKFVLCRLRNKADKFDHAPICDQAQAEPGSGSCSMASNVENQAAANGMNAEEDQLASKQPCSGGNHITLSALEIQAASNVMITEAEEFLAYKEMLDALQIPNEHEDAISNGLPTGSCLIDKNQLSNCVEGQPDTYNSSHSLLIEELFDDHEPVNLDSSFPQPQPPQPYQLPQPPPPQDYFPQSPISTELGNVSHGTIVHDDECRKRNYPFENNDPSLMKKKHISINDDDELVSNTASNSDNQATDGNPEGNFVICRMKNKSDKKDSSICDEGQPSSSHVVSNCENQAADDMIQEAQENGESLLHPPPPLDDCCSLALQSPTSLELEDVLQANGTNDDCNDLQSPFRDNDSCIRDKNEDEIVHDMLRELCALPEVTLDPLLRPFQQQDYTSSIPQSPIYTNLENAPQANVYNDECNNWQSVFKRNISTNEVDIPVSNITSNFENQATDYRILEVHPQTEGNLESSFYSFQPQDSTLQPLIDVQNTWRCST